jgi:O-antigen/teichoic acid export membrane protein
MDAKTPPDLLPAGTVNQGFAAAARRYSLSALGPLTISGAHFAASLLFLRLMPPAAFGLFAFVLVVVPFWLGISVALLGAPLVTTRKDNDWRELPTLMKANLVFCALATVATAAIMAASGAGLALALLFGLYGGLMCLRWFARWLAYSTKHPLRAAGSDIAYGVLLVAGLAALIPLHAATLANAAFVLCASAAAGLAVFGRAVIAQQLRALRDGALAAYAPIWRDLTQWALLGVVTTELSANAHAYLVTLLSGPKSFALIAAGSLFMRPVSLCLTALPDRERPLMVETLNARDHAAADRCVRDFRGAGAAIWLLTLALAGAVLTFAPALVLKADYDRGQVLLVVALWGAIMAVRTLRTPDAVLLQAAREFRPLASASVWSSVVSLGLTAVLLWTFGPVASMAGILIGDVVMTERVFALVRRWKRSQRWGLAAAV